MLTEGQLASFYDGLPPETVVRVEGGPPYWWIKTPTVMVKGNREVGVCLEGGLHSDWRQLPHKMGVFALRGFSTICLSQTGSSTVEKSPNFYEIGNFSRHVVRGLAILNAHRQKKVIAYGSSIGGPAAIALAAEHPERVVAVIAVNPSSLLRQNPWKLGLKFTLTALSVPEKDFVPPATPWPSIREMVREIFGEVKDLAASDIGLDYLKRVECPVLIYAGKKATLFPWQRLVKLEGRFPNVQVVVVDDFIHSDPNSLVKMDWLATDAMARLNKLGVI